MIPPPLIFDIVPFFWHLQFSAFFVLNLQIWGCLVEYDSELTRQQSRQSRHKTTLTACFKILNHFTMRVKSRNLADSRDLRCLPANGLSCFGWNPFFSIGLEFTKEMTTFGCENLRWNKQSFPTVYNTIRGHRGFRKYCV